MALIHCNFNSDTLGVACAMDVILPEQTQNQIGVESHSDGGLAPCLYLLHGLSDDHSIWQRRTSIERYVAPLGIAVVMPAVNRSFYCNMANGYRYWDFISEELPAKVAAMFRVSTRREDSFVAGLSMGGYGAFKLALRHPERFAAAASLSGALDLRFFREDRTEDARLVFGGNGGPQGTDADLFHVAAEAKASGAELPRLYQACGTEDFLYAHNQRFRGHAQELGLDLTYEEGPGAHEWGYWDVMIQRVLKWMLKPS